MASNLVAFFKDISFNGKFISAMLYLNRNLRHHCPPYTANQEKRKDDS
jgi:hypothetical protein